MEWRDVEITAESLGWPAYLGTGDGGGRPHVSVMAPGFGERTLWFATRRGSRKLANIAANDQVFVHWAVGREGPGELFVRGIATVHDSAEKRRRLWTEAHLPYDPSGFFGSPDNDDVVFVRVDVTMARLLGPDFSRRVWRRR